MKYTNVCLALFCILISLSIYKTAYGAWYDYLLGGTRTVEFVLEKPKTLDSEIDRLSLKYNVVSSTVRAVATCESSLYGSAINYNYKKDGTLHSIDKGYLQINNLYHETRMNQLGLDWNDEWDSLEYGIILLRDQGLTPWKASKGCWSQMI